jgi:hypothetical protein
VYPIDATGTDATDCRSPAQTVNVLVSRSGEHSGEMNVLAVAPGEMKMPFG